MLNRDRKAVLQEAAHSMTRDHGFDCAWFAERTDPDTIVIRYRSGMISDVSRDLILRRGWGLGGRVFALNKIDWVNNYLASSKITHHYDDCIRAEALKRIIGAPVWADGDFVGVILGGARDGATFGTQAMAVIESVASQTADALLAASLRERLTVLEEAAHEVMLQLREVESRAGACPCGIRPREYDVLCRVAIGQTNQEIAQAMRLSEHTVKSYLRNLMQRLGVRNRVEAIARAREFGFL